VQFSYNYNLVYATSAFEKAYFAYLNSIAVASPITFFQDQYNHQNAHSLTVNQNSKIDATMAEKWLGDHSLSMLGVDQQAAVSLNLYQTLD
jgi:hypothetical protein